MKKVIGFIKWFLGAIMFFVGFMAGIAVGNHITDLKKRVEKGKD